MRVAGDECFARPAVAERTMAMATIQHSEGAGGNLPFATEGSASAGRR